MVPSNDNADCLDEEDRLKYVDDISILEVLFLTGLLIDYDYFSHVPSYIVTDQKFLHSENFQTQDSINQISKWNENNLMQNSGEEKKYMIFTRCKSDFATILKVNGMKIDQLKEAKITGVWITHDLTWDKNTSEWSKKYLPECLC